VYVLKLSIYISFIVIQRYYSDRFGASSEDMFLK